MIGSDLKLLLRADTNNVNSVVFWNDVMEAHVLLSDVWIT